MAYRVAAEKRKVEREEKERWYAHVRSLQKSRRCTHSRVWADEFLSSEEEDE